MRLITNSTLIITKTVALALLIHGYQVKVLGCPAISRSHSKMKLEIPDSVVWSILIIVIAVSSTYIGIKIGRKEVDFSAAPRNSGSPKKRRKKSKGEALTPPPAPLLATQKEASDTEAEDGSTSDDGETSAETRSEIAQSSPQAQAGNSSSGGQVVCSSETYSNVSPKENLMVEEKKEKDKKKKKKKNKGAARGEGEGVSTGKEIEREVVAESANQVVVEEISAAAAAREQDLILSLVEKEKEAQSHKAEGEAPGGRDASQFTYVEEADDVGEWEIVEKRSSRGAAAQSRANNISSSATHEEGMRADSGRGDLDKLKKREGRATNGSNSYPPSSGAKTDNVEEVAPFVEVITVDIKHLGAVIGTRGSTRLALEKMYDTQIKVPKSERSGSGPTEVTIQGPQEGIRATIKAINQLCEKGYATCLGGEGFSEGAVQVHPVFLAEIVGKNGASARAIQEQMDVRLVIPQNGPGRESQDLVRVGVAGAKDKVKRAKELIKELIKYHHTEVTHPGYDHLELEEVPVGAHSHIIGKKGSEISKIQATFGVSVYIPYEHSSCKNVVLVGRAGEKGLHEAQAHIQEIVERHEAAVQAREAAAVQAREAAAKAPSTEVPTKSECAGPTGVSTPNEQPQVGDPVVIEEENVSTEEAPESASAESSAAGEEGEKD